MHEAHVERRRAGVAQRARPRPGCRRGRRAGRADGRSAGRCRVGGARRAHASVSRARPSIGADLVERRGRTAPSRRRARPRGAATGPVRPPIQIGHVGLDAARVDDEARRSRSACRGTRARRVRTTPGARAARRRRARRGRRTGAEQRRTPPRASRRRRRGSSRPPRHAVERAVALRDLERVVVAEHEHEGREADRASCAPRGSRRSRAGPSSVRAADRGDVARGSRRARCT